MPVWGSCSPPAAAWPGSWTSPAPLSGPDSVAAGSQFVCAAAPWKRVRVASWWDLHLRCSHFRWHCQPCWRYSGRFPSGVRQKLKKINKYTQGKDGTRFVWLKRDRERERKGISMWSSMGTDNVLDWIEGKQRGIVSSIETKHWNGERWPFFRISTRFTRLSFFLNQESVKFSTRDDSCVSLTY